MSVHLSEDLKKLVDFSVSVLGQVIRERLGSRAFDRIETCRRRMAGLRGMGSDRSFALLERTFKELQGLNSRARHETALSFALMLEIMNACENAYRSHQIRFRKTEHLQEKPESITYVLTAHPTEARAPENIGVFHELQKELTRMFDTPREDWMPTHAAAVRYWIEAAWRTPVVRARKPQVRDEAEHIYSTLLREETLCAILRVRAERAPVFVRSWVGGDKDGHPGVDEKAFVQSLSLSREGLVRFVRARLAGVDEPPVPAVARARLAALLRGLHRGLTDLSRLRAGDGRRVRRWREEFRRYADFYQVQVGAVHPVLAQLLALLEMFPALVVPLEIRESSDVLLSDPTGRRLAVGRMLEKLRILARGEDPRSYARGFIISMASSFEHLQVAARIQKARLGSLALPVIPLFEQAESLQEAPQIIRTLLRDPALSKVLRRDWDNRVEMMVGYSDSSKESGVLFSRLRIAESMHELNALCERQGVSPVFFQGSGGSVDRGGGSVDEQTLWWPSGALRHYKVTVQGEMIERGLASPEITRGQLERIIQSAGRWRQTRHRRFRVSRELRGFAGRVAAEYRRQVHSEEFLRVVQAATPYASLGAIKFGSRPAKRVQTVSVEGLRAIPWVLCWTQTRILFPTWWGLGTAWKSASRAEKVQLKKDFRDNPLFATFVRALGFTLLKIEPEIWRMHLRQSGLPRELCEKTDREFRRELAGALSFARFLLGGRQLLPSRPWLAESVQLRSPMIHPLNLLQILALRDHDDDLFRLTVAGIASGMMTTG